MRCRCRELATQYPMSDEWIFYPCQMGDQKASIFYDHGIRETIDQIAPPQLLKVRVPLKHPRQDGLSSNEEYQQLCNLEDDLQGLVVKHAAIYVGRVTVGGYRYIHVFTSDSETDWSARLRVLGERHDYHLAFVLTADSNRTGYWKDLFPNEDDWQVIQDLRVLDAIAKRGDDGSSPRHIDHWAYFAVGDAAEQFLRWIQERGYSSGIIDTADDGKFRVRFAHKGTLELSDITSHSMALRRKASELGGDYDGWETSVCKPSNQPAGK
jgi:hypothetical protein